MLATHRQLVATGLLAVASTVASIVVGWAEGAVARTVGLSVAGFLAFLGVLAARPPGELLGARGVPNMLPMDMPELVGDETLLNKLVEEESRMRAASRRRAGPRIILLHGKPGVGKTHLACHLAKRLAAHYPDGQLHGRLGTTNDRSPAAILVHFLMALGISEGDATHAQGKTRYDLFLAKTNTKKLLVVLDGVRNLDQLNEVMPNSPESLVIVTSRADLGPIGGSRSHRVEEPNTAVAEQILLDRAGADAGGRPDRLAQIVEQCGRLPFALCAAGRLARADPAGLDGVGARMTDRKTRLEYLSPPGRDTMDRIASAYLTLLPDEQKAFRRLSLVQSASFVPWVLQPLLDVGYDRAGPVMARLRDAQLVDPVDRDPIGAARYRLHPLFRLYAERKLAEDDSKTDVWLARERLDLAYAAAAGEVLAVLHQDFLPAVTCPPEHRPEGQEWRDRVARVTRAWVPVEYGNLIGAVHAAHAAADWGTCWRIAASVVEAPVPAGDHLIDPNDFRDAVLRAFTLARDAAHQDTSDRGAAAVWLAEAMHLVTVEDLRAACDLIDRHLDGTRVLDHGTTATAQRIKAQGLQMLSEHREAGTALVKALVAADAAGDDDERSRIEFLQKVSDCVLKPEVWKEVTAFQRAVAATNGELRVRAMLALAQGAGRAGDIRSQKENLALAYKETTLSAAGRARVLLAHAEQQLTLAVDASAPRDDVELTVRLAGHAVWAHQVLQCPLGAIHARAILARALLVAGREDDAEEQITLANTAYELLNGTPFPALRACLRLAAGELGLSRGAAAAPEDLQRAMEDFQHAGDFWHAARARLALGAALGRLERYPNALAQLWVAVTELRACGDAAGVTAAGLRLESTYRASGIVLNRRSRRTLRAMIQATQGGA